MNIHNNPKIQLWIKKIKKTYISRAAGEKVVVEWADPSKQNKNKKLDKLDQLLDHLSIKVKKKRKKKVQKW